MIFVYLYFLYWQFWHWSCCLAFAFCRYSCMYVQVYMLHFYFHVGCFVMISSFISFRYNNYLNILNLVLLVSLISFINISLQITFISYDTFFIYISIIFQHYTSEDGSLIFIFISFSDSGALSSCINSITQVTNLRCLCQRYLTSVGKHIQAHLKAVIVKMITCLM